MALKMVHIFVLLLGVSTAFALTCYKCDSSESKLCNYGIGSFTYDTVDCSKDENFLTSWVPKQCVKLVATGKDGSEYVARGCMPGLGENACRAVAKTLGFFSSVEGNIDNMDCFACDGDKCNSAVKFSAYSMLGVLLASLAFLF